MKLVFLSDTHGRHGEINVPDGDVLVHCGDLTADAGRASLRSFLQWFESQPHRYKCFVAGNHDWAYEKWHDLAVAMTKEVAPSCTYLQGTGCEIEGLRLWGSPITPEFYGWAFNRKRGPEIAAHWAHIPEGTDVLITHGPPKGFLDWNPGDKTHCGCEDLLDRIIDIQPKIHAFGHIHSGYGMLKTGLGMAERGWTTFINASICDYRYMPINPPITFEL